MPVSRSMRFSADSSETCPSATSVTPSACRRPKKRSMYGNTKVEVDEDDAAPGPRLGDREVGRGRRLPLLLDGARDEDRAGPVALERREVEVRAQHPERLGVRARRLRDHHELVGPSRAPSAAAARGRAVARRAAHRSRSPSERACRARRSRTQGRFRAGCRASGREAHSALASGRSATHRPPYGSTYVLDVCSASSVASCSSFSRRLVASCELCFSGGLQLRQLCRDLLAGAPDRLRVELAPVGRERPRVRGRQPLRLHRIVTRDREREDVRAADGDDARASEQIRRG